VIGFEQLHAELADPAMRKPTAVRRVPMSMANNGRRILKRFDLYSGVI